jgi:hypothetical protein
VGSEPELRATARAFVVGAFAELTSEKARVAGLFFVADGTDPASDARSIQA